MPGTTHIAMVALPLAFAGLGGAWAQGIYTCVDAKGRRITSDRPILECIDREQRELTGTGTVKRILKPSPTAEEAAAQEEAARKAADEKTRQAEEKKRDRALLARYPDRLAHDRERTQALVQIEIVIDAAHKRSADLAEERRKLVREAEFYKGDRSKMPAALKRQLDQNEQLVAAQKRFIENQADERQRVIARFDDELVKLQQLWAQQRKSAAAAPKP